MAHDKVAEIPVSKIRHNAVLLRPVDKEKEEYIKLVDSVKKRGVCLPLYVREYADPENKGQVLYGIIDGTMRYNAALDAGLTVLPAKITTKEDAEVEELQIILNATRVQTRPVEYAKAIIGMLRRNPTMTMNEVAVRLNQSTTWLNKVLTLVSRLHDSIKPLANEGGIVTSNAIELAKLPLTEQLEWQDKAMTMSTGEFAANVAQRVKEIREARSKGKAEKPAGFIPIPKARAWKDVKAEFETGCPTLIALARRNKITTPEDAIKMTIAWASLMDPDTQAEQRAEYDAREAKSKAEAEARKLERETKKIEEATKTREELLKKLEERGALQAIH